MSRDCKIYSKNIYPCNSNGQSAGTSKVNQLSQADVNQLSGASVDEKSKAITEGHGIHRDGYSNKCDTKEFLDSLQTTFKVKCRGKNGDVFYDITCNKSVAETVKQIFCELYNIKVGNKWFKIIQVPHTYCYREVAGKGTLSNHAYGVAIDINQSVNPYRKSSDGQTDSETRIRSNEHPVVKLFKEYGWGWGGKYYDYMHFSYFDGN